MFLLHVYISLFRAGALARNILPGTVRIPTLKIWADPLQRREQQRVVSGPAKSINKRALQQANRQRRYYCCHVRCTRIYQLARITRSSSSSRAVEAVCVQAENSKIVVPSFSRFYPQPQQDMPTISWLQQRRPRHNELKPHRLPSRTLVLVTWPHHRSHSSKHIMRDFVQHSSVIGVAR